MSLFLGKIHYWLFNKILWFEGLENEIINLANEQGLDIEKLSNEINLKYGEKLPNKNLEDMIDAKEIYNSINDYILDGMPCDRVNEIITSEDNCVEYRRRICVHKDIWNKENGDVNTFYKLRSLWIKAFVNEVKSDFEYTENSDGISTIKRKQI